MFRVTIRRIECNDGHGQPTTADNLLHNNKQKHADKTHNIIFTIILRLGRRLRIIEPNTGRTKSKLRI